MKEITEKSRGNYYWYSGKQEKLDTPVELKVGNNIISYKYSNRVEKVNDEKLYLHLYKANKQEC